MVRKIALATVAVLAIASFALHAASSGPSTFNATARVNTNCTFTSATFSAIAFGNYDPLVVNAAAGPADLTASTTLSVNCTKGTAPTLTLSGGANGFTNPDRHMKNSANADLLAYTLTKPNGAGADSLAPWLDTDLVAMGTSASRATALSITVFGHLAGNQNVSVGDYSDTVSATVNY